MSLLLEFLYLGIRIFIAVFAACSDQTDERTDVENRI
jgi:hypothetical protein